MVLAIGRGEFRSRLIRMHFGRLWMRSGEASLPYIMRGAWFKNRVVVSFLIGQDPTPYQHNGKELLPGAILLNPPGTEFHRRSTGTRCASVSLAPEDLAATGRAIAGLELTAPDATRMIRPPAHLMARLLALYAAAEGLATTVPDLMAHPDIARALEQELVHALICCLAECALLGTDHSRSRHVPIMQRFEEFLAANRDKPLYVAEICRAIGITDRTLHLQCIERVGVSPQRYLWLRRMHQARRSLVVANAANKTVTEIAMDHGWSFSVAYGKFFGEPPLATLRRAV